MTESFTKSQFREEMFGNVNHGDSMKLLIRDHYDVCAKYVVTRANWRQTVPTKVMRLVCECYWEA